MSENHKIEDQKSTEIQELEREAQTDTLLKDEFEITVRKLEMPVRPRGVLAE